jgi:hypothetical protein
MEAAVVEMVASEPRERLLAAAARPIGDRLGWHGPDPRGHGHRYAKARRWCSARKA